MLVQGDELAEDARGERGRHDRSRRTVAREDARRHDVLGRPLRTHLLGGLAEGEGLRLREEVREEQLVHVLLTLLEGPRRIREGDEVGRDHPRALVDELVEGVLAVRAGLPPEDLARVVGHGRTVAAHRLAVRLHRELLKVGRETVQVLRVGQDRVGVGAEEVRVPDVEQAHEQRDVVRGRSGREVLVHRAETGEEVLETIRTDREGEGGADRRIHGVATADPAPEAEGVVRIDAELGDLVQSGRDGDEVLRDRLLLPRLVGRQAAFAQRAEEPLAHDLRVRDRLEGREGLGGDDDEGRLRIEALRRLARIRGVDVRDETALEAFSDEGLERLVRHDRAEVGTADADVHDGLDRLAGDARPFARAHAVGEVVDLREDLVDIGDRVLAVDLERVLGRAPQRRVEDGPVLGDIDVLAREHAVAQIQHARLLGERQQLGEHVLVDEILREVDMQIGCIARPRGRPLRVGREPGPQVGVESVGTRVERLPRGRRHRIDRRDIGHDAPVLGGFLEGRVY